MPDAFRAIVTDIEGTTTPIRFVTETLFPFARRRLPGFIRDHARSPEVAAPLAAIRAETGRPLSDAEATALLLDWMDEDRKATPLKTLQGLIWAEGYAAGILQGALYADVAACLKAWHREGVALYGYSSGSSEAQHLLFRHSADGDLSGLFNRFFDTRIGGKLAPDSYRVLADRIGCPASEILFLSDNEGELDAARAAGIATACLDRDRDGRSGRHPVHRDFTTMGPVPPR